MRSLLSFTLSSLLGPPAAATELSGAILEVERAPNAEDCPDAETLKARTLSLGTSPAQRSAPMQVRVEFNRVEQRYQATVHTRGRSSGSRRVLDDGPDCAPLAAATSLILAFLLDLRPPGEPPVARQNATSPTPADAPAVFRFVAVGARASLAYGLLGRALSLSFGGDARLRLAYLELELSGFAARPRTVDYPPGSVTVSVAAGGAGLCVYPNRRGATVELAACGSVLLGRIQGSGNGFFVDREAASLWTAGRFGATFAVPLARHWAVRVGTDLLVPFRRYALDVGRLGVVYAPFPAAFALTFGPEFRFL